VHHKADNQDVSDNLYFGEDKEAKIFLGNKNLLRKIFEDDNKVRLVIHGHTHFSHQEVINGITYLTIPSLTENNTKGEPCERYTEITINDKNHKIDIKYKTLAL